MLLLLMMMMMLGRVLIIAAIFQHSSNRLLVVMSCRWDLKLEKFGLISFGKTTKLVHISARSFARSRNVQTQESSQLILRASRVDWSKTNMLRRTSERVNRFNSLAGSINGRLIAARVQASVNEKIDWLAGWLMGELARDCSKSVIMNGQEDFKSAVAFSFSIS